MDNPGRGIIRWHQGNGCTKLWRGSTINLKQHYFPSIPVLPKLSTSLVSSIFEWRPLLGKTLGNEDFLLPWLMVYPFKVGLDRYIDKKSRNLFWKHLCSSRLKFIKLYNINYLKAKKNGIHVRYLKLEM